MSFEKNGYVVMKNFISKEIASLTSHYLMQRGEVHKIFRHNNLISPFDNRFGVFGDEQVPNVFCLYGDPLTDSIMKLMTPEVEQASKRKLIPNYTYCRIYERGCDLKKHRDRLACEISGTIFLGGDPWPIFIDPTGSTKGKGKKIVLKEGDALFYKGNLLDHWREPFEGNICIQTFIHYNTTTTPNAKNFDGRPCLGFPVID